MAGIGFELRKILMRNTFASSTAAYSASGIISTGPWVISILGILILGYMVAPFGPDHKVMTQFQISITYLIALSLILSGFGQHSFTRFISDELFLNNNYKVVPNLNGVLLLNTVVCGILAFIFVLFWFPRQSILYHILFMATFVVLANIWIVTNLLAGLKSYKLIVLAFFLGYGITLLIAYYSHLEVDKLLLSFFVGQSLILAILTGKIYNYYPSNSLIDFEFLKSAKIYPPLLLTGFCYNLGIWVDKFIFWYTPSTSYPVIGPLRGSIIYDIPIFLAYLALIPGMAIFLLRVETDFVEYYHHFYGAIRNGLSLSYIQSMRNKMVDFGQNAIYDIFKVQAVTIVIIFLTGQRILQFLHISTIYTELFFIDVIGTSLQIIFLAILNILFYLDKKRDALYLSILFVVFNIIFTIISIKLGPFFYGFGFTVALGLVCSYGMYLLSYEFTDTDYKTIMLQ